MPHQEIPADLQQRPALEKSAIYVALFITMIMFLLKGYGWYVTDSLSILSSFIDSLMDLLISGINLFAIYYALKPADYDHRYGHNSIEDIACLLQAAILAGSSLLILIKAMIRFGEPIEAPQDIGVGLQIMIASLILTTIIILYQRFVISKSNSDIIRADHLHYLSDLLFNVAVIASLFLWQKFSWNYADPILSLIIVLFIIRGAFRIGRRAINNLMDTEMVDSERDKIINVLNAIEGHKGFHDLRTRRSGRKVFIQLHLELDNKLALKESYKVATKVRTQLRALYQDADIIVHQEPVETLA